MSKISNNIKTIQKIILLIITSIISIIYIYKQPIDYHCDSATFYNFGSKISEIFSILGVALIIPLLILIYFLKEYFINLKNKNIIFFSVLIIIFLTILLILLSLFSINTPFAINDFTRPPVYPFFLFASGIYYFNTFYTLFFFQAVLSIISTYLIYEIIYKLTNKEYFSFLFTLFYSITSIPYILIKFLSAEHLMYFFIILFCFSIINFYYSKKIYYIYFALLSSLLCWFTKWEGQLLFFIFIIFIVLSCLKSNNYKIIIKHILNIFIITLIFLSMWTVSRSIVSNNFSTILNISNASMDQTIWRLYSSMPSTISIYEEALDIRSENSGKFISDIYPNQRKGTLIIDEINGPNSKKLFFLILEAMNENPKSFLKIKKNLDESYLSTYQKEKGINYYYELFGKFKNNEEIVNNIAKQPNIFYFNYFNQLLINKIGKSEKDKLYKKVARESLLKNPIIFVNTISNFFDAYGINLEGYILNSEKLYGRVRDINFVMPYNGGKCAENNLTSNKFNEYKYSNNSYKVKSVLTKFIDFNDYLTDSIRDYLGIIIIIAYIILMYHNFILFFPIILVPSTFTLAVALLVDSPINSKYEVNIFPINFIIISYLIFIILKYIFYDKKN